MNTVLESLLYIALGALLAVLFVLLIAPAIWRRAVVLTRQRMEAAVPLTLTELQAEKDQLRAGHALAVRKLEDDVKRLSGKLAAVAIDMARKRDAMFELESEGVRHSTRILELETETAGLQDDLQDTSRKLDRTTAELQAARSEMAQRALELDTLNVRHLEISDDFDGQKIEIAARETKLETAQQQTRDVRDALKRKMEEADRLTSTLKQSKRDLESQNEKLAVERRKITTLQTRMADNEARLERRNADLARLRATKGDSGDLLANAEAEIDRLNSALIEAQSTAGAVSHAANHDMTALRAMLTDLAARMTAQVAQEEGPGSQVDEALAAIAALNFEQNGAQDGETLADRIRTYRSPAERA